MKKITLIDTYLEGGWSYDDYLEYCDVNEIEPHKEGSTAYWSWIADQISNDYEDFLFNVLYSQANKHEVMVFGHTGRWDGTHEIVPLIFNSLYDAIKELNDGYDDIQVYSVNGEIEFRGLHHDGTDIFNIRPINEKRLRIKCASDVRYSKNPCWYCGKFPKYIF